MVKGVEYLAWFIEMGLIVDIINQYLQFGIVVSKSYFVEIVKFRVFCLFWSNVLKGYGVKGKQFFVVVYFVQELQDENLNFNMICVSMQAMFVVIGGVDWLYVLFFNWV